jgi:hypothetical protein
MNENDEMVRGLIRDKLAKKVQKIKNKLNSKLIEIIHENENEFFGLVFGPYSDYLKSAPEGYYEYMLAVSNIELKTSSIYLFIDWSQTNYIHIDYPHTLKVYPVFLNCIHCTYDKIHNFSKFGDVVAVCQILENIRTIWSKKILPKYNTMTGIYPNGILAQVPELIPLIRDEIPESWLPEKTNSLLEEQEVDLIRKLIWFDQVL